MSPGVASSQTTTNRSCPSAASLGASAEPAAGLTGKSSPAGAPFVSNRRALTTAWSSSRQAITQRPDGNAQAAGARCTSAVVELTRKL